MYLGWESLGNLPEISLYTVDNSMISLAGLT